MRAWGAIVVAFVVVFAGLGTPANAQAQVCRPKLAGLELPAEKVHSGGTAQGSVRLSCAPRRTTTVTLTSADPTWVGVPPSVTVPAGQNAAGFVVQTYQPGYLSDSDFSVAVTASSRGQTITQPVRLQPGLRAFTPDSAVTSGEDVSIQIRLNGPAPEGGLAVTVESDNDALRVPASITIPQGSSGVVGGFGKTVRVQENTNVTLTAKLPGQTMTAVVELRAWTYDPGEWSLTGPEFMHGGGFYYPLTLNLPNPVPEGGLNLTFSSDNPRLNLPSSLRLSAGTSGALEFDLSAPNNIEDGDATITATLEGVGSRSHTLNVRPGVSQIDLPWPLYGDQTFEGTLHLGATTSRPLVVKLTTDNPALRVPAEVTVPAGQSSVTFTGSTAHVDEFQYVTLTAQLDRTYFEHYVFIDPPPGG